MAILDTAMMIVPGYEVQLFAAPLRARYTPPSKLCFPAHLTLLYPFMSPADADQHHDEIAAIIGANRPFEVTLDHYRRFPKAWALEPRHPESIVSLQRQLTQAFPSFLPYSGEHGPELVPHLTLAHFEEPSEGDAVSLPDTPTLHFIVDRIHLYLGPSEEATPSIPLAVFPLEGGK